MVFFLVIKPVNALMERTGRGPERGPGAGLPRCLSKVPEAATRCAYCTSALTPTASATGT